MLEKHVWDAKKGKFLAQSAAQKKLEQAVLAYFTLEQAWRAQRAQDMAQASASQAVEQSLAAIKSAMLQEGSLYVSPLIWVLQICNAVLDAEIKGLSALCAAQGQPFVCAAGCTGCCHQMVLSTSFENALIHVYLQENAFARAHFLHQWDTWYAQAKDIHESYLAWGKAVYGDGIDDKSHSREDYYIPCPFLDSAGSCVIYAVRPYACRSAVAVDSRCVTGNAQGYKGMYSMLAALYTGHAAARQRLYDTVLSAETRLEKTLMPLAIRENFFH